jgi:hypothetical protein
LERPLRPILGPVLMRLEEAQEPGPLR